MSKTKLQTLQELLGYVKFERAAFGHIHTDPKDPLPKKEDQVTDFVKRRTHLYMETWVIPTIEEMIKTEVEVLEKARRNHKRRPR